MTTRHIRNNTVEVVCFLFKLHDATYHVSVKLDMDELDLTSAESRAAYEKIKKYVTEHNEGMKARSLNIAQVKRRCKLELVENFNPPRSEYSRQLQCPVGKKMAIRDVLE